MNSRDFILREIEKLTITIGRLIGLKEAGKTDELMKLADSTVLNEFNMPLDQFIELPIDDFNAALKNKNYSVEKLDALAQLLYLTCDLYDINIRNESALNKVICIFDLLESKYHWQSFENIQKRNIISTLLPQQ